MSKNIYDHGLFFTRTPTAVRYEIRRSLIQIRPSLPQRYERMGCQYSMGAPPCCFSRPFRAPKLSGQNRPENRKEPWTNLELNPDVLSSFEAASGELLVAILSRSFVSRSSIRSNLKTGLRILKVPEDFYHNRILHLTFFCCANIIRRNNLFCSLIH
ncbi:unnamed protein product, partial [Vitis vinifera]